MGKSGPENALQKQVIAALKEVPFCFPIRVNTGRAWQNGRLIQMNSEDGTSDILCCYRGFFVAIELKRPDKPLSSVPPSDNQIDFLNKVESAGGFATVANSVSQVLGFLKQIDERLNREKT